MGGGAIEAGEGRGELLVRQPLAVHLSPMAARRNLLPVFLARAATVISPHRAPTQERAGTAGDAEFVRACAAVLASLAAVHKALADEATRAAESVVPLVAQDVREAEDALADAGSSLASLGGVLRRVRCCSSQQQAHYGAMLQQLGAFGSAGLSFFALTLDRGEAR